MAVVMDKIANDKQGILEIVSNLQQVKSELSNDYYIRKISQLS
jgi:hypothetical protein